MTYPMVMWVRDELYPYRYSGRVVVALESSGVQTRYPGSFLPTIIGGAAMSDDNVTWEPIPPGDAVDYDMSIGPDNELRVVTELGEMVVEFDDAIRLCRAVAPQWRQEPPTEPGDWWLWWKNSISECRPILVYVVMGDVLVVEYPWGESAAVANHPPAWWLPATLPSPPRT